jgi:hypothetical protein
VRLIILFRPILMLLFIGSAWAQNPTDLFSKAPPDVDEALRARVTTYYQAFVDGKPRRAEALVAEDSQDFFYNMKKTQLLSFEIGKLEYSENFTRAKAVVIAETYVMAMGFGSKPVKVPITSLWKLVDGQWFWYITEELINTTPFGKIGNAPTAKAGGAAPLPDMSKAPDLQTLINQVRPDKFDGQLKRAVASSDQITIVNHMPGTVKLAMRHFALPGLEVKLDRTELKANEKAIVSFHYTPGEEPAPTSVRVEVAVQPTNAVIPLQINFK